MKMSSDYYMKKLLNQPQISDLGSEKSQEIYSLLGINADIAKRSQIRILDRVKEDDLILVSALAKNQNNLKGAEHVKGLIIDISSVHIVAGSFPHTEEYSSSSPSESFVFCPKNSIVTEASEGTILRMFRGKNTKMWYLSTQRKINGRQSRWNGPSFGEMFDEAWGDPEEYPYGDYLSQGMCYIFLVSHPENRLVCDIQKPSIVFVGGFPVGDVNYKSIRMPTKESLIKFHHNVKIQYPLHIHSVEELSEAAKTYDWKKHTGLLVTDLSRFTCYKLVRSEYTEQRRLRGDEPNFKLRYLQLSESDVVKFRELFPEKSAIFDQLEEDLKQLKIYLSNLYEERYVNRNYSQLPTEEHFILETTRRNFDPDITLEENIQETLDTSNPRQLNAMINHMNESPDFFFAGK